MLWEASVLDPIEVDVFCFVREEILILMLKGYPIPRFIYRGLPKGSSASSRRKRNHSREYVLASPHGEGSYQGTDC